MIIFNLFFSRHFLYQMAFLRQRFDKNKNIVDMRKATVLLNAGEEELFQKKHYQPKICKDIMYSFINRHYYTLFILYIMALCSKEIKSIRLKNYYCQ